MGNKVIGKVGPKLGIYEESNDAQLSASLGQKREMDDGRVFRLCLNGAGALTAGVLVQSIVSLASDDSLEIATSQSIGDKEVNVTADATSVHAAHTLKDGYLVMSDTSTDIGTFYKIKDNEALVSGEDGIIYLYDGLTTAIVAGTNECSICVNPYSGVIIDANTAPLVGVPLIAVTAAYYFWALEEGVGPGTDGGSGVAAGDYLIHTAGDLNLFTIASGAEAPIAIAVTAGAANDALIVKYFGIG